ncbi:ABC-type transport system involved in resistance to organic solvents, ATPase component [Synechococcus sp. PCC 7502]|uniref:ABC transporter ATP-binding protein n=1 Tax=Synechococcus sp. PCC 7502 TaxID=1173263 RepID=UPI00029FEF21|nr:ABC transporter ATP-binding protein [Synechococcus sp. PCC 7502]AFY73873.1 ABC-type transport system involved in resistance to organic solvents, ATPase component [Synechococcus sp. PCC 7502]
MAESSLDKQYQQLDNLSTPILELQGIHKSFGNTVILNGIDLKIYDGDAVAIIGPSGTGKSTILRIITGLLAPDSGQVLVNGKPLHSIAGTDDDVHIGMVFQQAALFDSLTVEQNVGFSLFEHSHLSHREIAEMVQQKLALVGLPNIGDRYPSQLSGGMRKRVSFARAIVEDATEKAKKILLYDEPTAGLDPVASTIIEDLIRSLKTEQQVCDSYIVVTHQESTIRRTADRVIMLYEGNVRWEGTIDEIDSTDDPYVQQFLSGSKDGPIQIIAKEVQV